MLYFYVSHMCPREQVDACSCVSLCGNDELFLSPSSDSDCVCIVKPLLQLRLTLTLTHKYRPATTLKPVMPVTLNAPKSVGDVSHLSQTMFLLYY